MGFGSKSKKRESWSSRPLSMILPDNVWLFKNKSRSSMEKAMQQSGTPANRQVEQAKPAPAAAVRPSQDTARAAPASRASTSSRTASGSSTSTREPRLRSREPEPAQEPREALPFLTLNLDSSKQRLDVPEQYLDESVISDEFYSQTGLSDRESTAELPESVLGPLGGMSVRDTASARSPAPSMLGGQTTAVRDAAAVPSPVFAPAGVPAAAAATATASASAPAPTATPTPAAGEFAGADPAPIFAPGTAPGFAQDSVPVAAASGSPELVFNDGTPLAGPQDTSSSSSSTDSPTSLNLLTPVGAARESTVDSASSAATVDARAPRDSYVLGSNRKVVIGRGVYIFDPAEPGAARELQLSAAESFNPFEFE